MTIVQFSLRKNKKKHRLYHQIKKFRDPRKRFILIGDLKHIENDMCKLFYGLSEQPDYFVLPKHGVRHHYTKWNNTLILRISNV